MVAPKLTIAPDQSGYAVSYGNDTVYDRADGPGGVVSRNLFNNSNIVDATWYCDKDEYDYLAACNRAGLRKAIVFKIDLLLDDILEKTEYEAQFVPNTFRMSVQGETFTVSCQLEIKPLPYDVTTRPFIVDTGLADRRFRALAGIFTLSGQEVSFKLSATHIRHQTGYFAITGGEVNIIPPNANPILHADFGLFTISGQPISFMYSSSGGGDRFMEDGTARNWEDGTVRNEE